MPSRTLRLTSQQAASYHDKGYLLYQDNVLSPDRFTSLKGIFESLLANRGDLRADQLDVPHFTHPELLDILLADEVLDLVEPLIGPDIGLWASHFICKEPNIGRATPWHEDSAYWDGRFDNFTGIVTVWLALDKVDAENGAMKVIPGTHLQPEPSRYEDVDPASNTFGSRIVDVPEDQAVTFELESNQCSLHDSRIIHGADANTSSRRRAGYTMRYFSQQMKYNPDHPGNPGFKIWHARGANPHANPVVNG